MKYILPIMIIAVLFVVGCSAPVEEFPDVDERRTQDNSPSIRANDQRAIDSTVFVEHVASPEPVWVALHQGTSGPIIGYAWADIGQTRDLIIPLNGSITPGMVTAVLYTDRGELGTFEPEGADVPLFSGTSQVSDSFSITE